jgi:hypothetical protein
MRQVFARVELTIGCILVVMLLVAGSRLTSSLSLNLAHIALNKTLWRGEQTALERQQALSLASTMLEIASRGEANSPTDVVSVEQCSMIPSMVIGDYYRKHKSLQASAAWLRRAVTAEPYPAIQSAIVLPGWTSVTPQGDIVLDWSTAHWDFRGDSQLANLAFDDENGWLNISYHNQLGQRDTVIYTWSGPLEIPYWHTLCLRAKVYPGTFLTFSTHSVDGVERHVDYHRGTGEWEEFTIPLDVDSIKWIYVSLREPSPDPDTPDYAIDIEPLTFLLDDAVGECEL